MSLHPHRLLIDGDATMFLKLASPDDSEKMYELVHANREHLARYQRWAKDIDFETMHAAVQNAVRMIAEDSWLQYRIMKPQADQDHQMIGTITLYQRNILESTACMGVWLAEQEQGKGFARKACQRLLTYAFHAWNLSAVYLEIDLGNERSEGLATRLGAIPAETYQHEDPDGTVLTRRKWVIRRP